MKTRWLAAVAAIGLGIAVFAASSAFAASSGYVFPNHWGNQTAQYLFPPNPNTAG